MHAQIVVESLFGNTRTVADAVADGLRGRGCDVVVDPPSPGTPLRPGDLLVVLGPTHALGMSRPSTRADAVRQGAGGSGADGIREWIDRLPPASPGDARFACADTRVSPWIPGSAARSAHRALRHRGYRPAAPPESFVVTGNGPLRPGEPDRARAWARTLVPAPTTTGTP
ncbi:hypothetical protein Ae168Ps1_0761 [Pseudonocardia sp. Ae168_Ps1]|uniref:flavodoxin family protein n=1 Tax=unclassified Pseudonocardia TaxID=2619320 RepID=UPI0006CB28A7|nr:MULTISPECIES: hypothetical protein [unclassified Pseudonocardia]ALE73330.1 hypothetical protein FRP1_10025 [Pseudonocardia sp. EC080625-04]ALL76667.1 hypothetical protein AD006_17580 [Pseudonocardia sp. EC080610-09]ALL83695.1 hypothetical protein AD017_25415 [Pseudonocardia sp. EC080619-01]OLL72383.1 hypothetical protein Ae150APs1_0761 [Pseudonocardia sp. Ae150A_Ps1]OLL78355.1 hypothetical protein Ae168Ps1_0761 [Pseudonocardia sp. Ae168_Ps1]